MYPRILTFSLIFIAAVAEVSLLPAVFFGNIAPDVVLILIIIWSSRQSFENFWLWAIMAGITLDAVAMERIGTSAIVFLLLAFAINSLSKRFFVAQRTRAFWGVVALVILGTGISYGLETFLGVLAGSSSFRFFSFRILGLKLINNIIVLAIIYWPVASSRIIFPAEKSRLLVR